METKNTYFSEKEKALRMFGWTSKRYKGISIAYTAMLMIALPLIEFILLMQSKAEKPLDTYVDIVAEAAPDLSGSIFTFMVILFSTILAIVAFSYMHNKRCMDLFGSFPMSRRTLFFTRYVSVLVQAIVPMIVVGLMGAVMTLRISTFIEVMETVAFLCLGVIGNVSFIALLSLCCGTVIDMIISFLAINGIYPICILISTAFPKSILPGYGYSISNSDINWSLYTLFSPLFAPFAGIWGYDTTVYVVWWILFSAVLIGGCYIFSKKRKTETAQNEFVFVVIEQVIKLFAGFVVGFGMGWILALIGAAGNSSYKVQYIWFFVGFCIGALMTGIILHLIYHRGLTKIKMSLIVSAIDVVIGVTFVTIVVTGAFGYDERVPDMNDIKEVSVYVDDTDRYIVNGKDVKENYTSNKQLIESALDVHKDIIKEKLKDKKGSYPIIPEVDWSDEEYITSNIRVSYKLKNGQIIQRNYEGKFNGEKVEQLSNYAKQTVDAKKLLETLPINEMVSVNFQTDEYGFSLMDYDESSVKIKASMKRLREALLKDYKEVDKEDLKEKNSLYTIEFGYENARTQSIWFDCIVTKECKNTLELINREYRNTDYMFLKQQIGSDYLAEYEFTGKDEKTVYFKVPDEWDDKTEIRAILFNPVEYSWLVENIDEKITKCQHVKDNIWKYTYSLPKDWDEEQFEMYNKIMFYQILDDKVNVSGAVRITDDFNKNCLVLGKKKREGIGMHDEALYKYSWENLK